MEADGEASLVSEFRDNFQRLQASNWAAMQNKLASLDHDKAGASQLAASDHHEFTSCKGPAGLPAGSSIIKFQMAAASHSRDCSSWLSLTVGFRQLAALAKVAGGRGALASKRRSKSAGRSGSLKLSTGCNNLNTILATLRELSFAS